MYGYGYYGYGMDPTVLLLVIGMILSLAASAKHLRVLLQYIRK